MTCSILEDLESANNLDDTKRVLQSFIEKNHQNTSFTDISEPNTRDKIWNILRNILNEEKETLFEVCLTTICILSRDKSMINSVVVDEKLIDTLLHLACLKDDDCSLLKHSAVVIEALKCLCNLMFNSTKVQSICSKCNAADGIVRRIRTYPDTNIPFDIKYFDMILLFLITALIPETRSRLKIELHAVTYLTEVLSFILSNGARCTDQTNQLHSLSAVDEQYMKLSSEILKVMFNLTLKDSNVQDEESSYRLVSIMRELLLFSQSSSMSDTICSNVIKLLINMPGECLELLMPEEEPEDNRKAVDIILSFFERKLRENPEHKLNEVLSPTLVLLISACRQHKILRRTVRQVVLPPLKSADVTHLPEDGDSLRGRLCKLLTSVHIQIRDLVTELLFVLCKENVNRIIKYTGFGNAAGMLAQRGLLAGQKESEVVYSSDSEDSETEGYIQCKDKINPITGRIEDPPCESPLTSMSEEQKEYKAMKLVNMLDELQKQRIIQPCVIGKDGKPRPVEHVSEFREKYNK